MINKLPVPLITLCFLAANGAAALHLYQPAHEYTDAEIAELNRFELTLLAKEPYAIQGHVFDEDWLMDFYLATDWYGPVHGTREDIAAATTFTPKEERDMARFEEEAAELKPTYDGCWPVADLAGREVKYYRKLSSAKAPKLELPPAFYELGAADGISVWSRPAVAAADALAQEPGAGDYYRVYFGPGGGVAAAEAMRASGGKPHAMWKAWFDGVRGRPGGHAAALPHIRRRQPRGDGGARRPIRRAAVHRHPLRGAPRRRGGLPEAGRRITPACAPIRNPAS
jgi:hypothetical protein